MMNIIIIAHPSVDPADNEKGVLYKLILTRPSTFDLIDILHIGMPMVVTGV